MRALLLLAFLARPTPRPAPIQVTNNAAPCIGWVAHTGATCSVYDGGRYLEVRYHGQVVGFINEAGQFFPGTRIVIL